MKYQCLNNIGIIEKFLFYHKTEYDYDAVAGKKDMLSYATVRRGADSSKTREWSWSDRGKDTILFSDKQFELISVDYEKLFLKHYLMAKKSSFSKKNNCCLLLWVQKPN